MEQKACSAGRKATKLAGAACLATGMVALSGLVASGAAVGAVVEGFRSAKRAMDAVLKEEKIEMEAAEEN